MASGYIRQAAANISAGLGIHAADHNAEYNQIQAAFDNSTGHDHSGSASGVGAKISLTAAVSGILPLANGGTAINATTGTGLINSLLALSGSARLAALNGLDVTGSVTVSTTLGVTGITTVGTINAVTITASGNITAATGSVNAVNVFATNNMTAVGLSVSGAATLSSTLAAGNTTITGTLSATGTSTLGVVNSGNHVITGNLSVSGSSAVATINASGNIVSLGTVAGAVVSSTSYLSCLNGAIYTAYSPNIVGLGWSFPNLNVIIDNAFQFTILSTSSDERLKTNIVSSTIDPLDKLRQLKLSSFDFPSRDKHYDIGLIAQDVQLHMPEAVVAGPVQNAEIPHLLQLDWMPLVAYLIGAVQQLANKIEDLKGVK